MIRKMQVNKYVTFLIFNSKGCRVSLSPPVNAQGTSKWEWPRSRRETTGKDTSWERIQQLPIPVKAKTSNQAKAVKRERTERSDPSAGLSDQCTWTVREEHQGWLRWVTQVTEQCQDFMRVNDGLGKRQVNGVLRTEFPDTSGERYPAGDQSIAISSWPGRTPGQVTGPTWNSRGYIRH